MTGLEKEATRELRESSSTLAAVAEEIGSLDILQQEDERAKSQD